MTEVPFTLQHLKDRCTEVGDCWEWSGTYLARRPVITSRRDWEGNGVRAKQFAVRHLTYWHAKGAPPKLGTKRTVRPSCGNWRCVCPEHQKLVSRADVQKTALKPPGFGAKISATRRKSSKLSDEAVAEIRASSEGTLELAQRFGISRAYVYMIQKSQFRKDYSSPFAGLFTGLAMNDSTSRRAA